MSDAVTAFLVVLRPSNRVDVYTADFPEITVERQADLADVESAGLRIAAEANRALIIDALAPDEPPTPSDLVAQALAKRVQED